MHGAWHEVSCIVCLLFESTLALWVPQNEGIRFLVEADHVHSSSDECQEEFEALIVELGAEGED